MVDLIHDLSIKYTPTPSEENFLTEIANTVKNQIICYIDANRLQNLVKEVVYGGSFAKGTWLKDEADIDIFIKFNQDVELNEFEKYGTQIGMQSLKEYSPYLRYSDHPYVESFVRGIKVNVVPCYDVSNGNWKSAADRSPFHTKYVINHLTEYEKNQVRILKKFLKSLDVYGAEISTEGFSGYVTEVLILKFGSFKSTLQYFSNFSIDNKIISIKNIMPGKFFDSFIIILDPIDENRNLGAAISPQSVAILIRASRNFLAEPKINFFLENTKKYQYSNNLKMININNQTINLLASNILVIEFEYGARPLDVIWGQLKKTTNSIYKSIQAYGFTVIKRSCSVYEKDKTCVIAFLMESVTIPKLYYRTGPEVFRHEDVDKFIESNRLSPLIWMDNDTRIKCLMFREHKNVVDYLEFIIKSRADMIGITKGLKHDFFNSVRVFLVDKQFLKKNEQVRNNAIYKLLYTDERIF